METHKFKFYHPQHGTCGGFTLLEIIQNIDVYEDLDDEGVIQRQYTGRKDIENVEAYAGDIIEYTEPLEGECAGWQTHRVVIFWEQESDSWQCENPNNDNLSGALEEWLDGEYGKIIGNIYENPELLEATP